MKRIKLNTNRFFKRIIPNSGNFIKSFGVLALAIGSYTMSATNGTETSVKPERIIEENIKLPKLSQPISQNEKVKIVFTTDENGKVNYCLAKTQNAELKKALESQFREFKLVNTKSNTAYTIVINFKTL